MRTLLLDASTWDLVLDADANIAVASDPYSQAQDAASQIKTYQGEVYYDTADGIPYYQNILGHAPPLGLMKAQFVDAAKEVPGVTAARAVISGFSDRRVSGQVQITNATGETALAAFQT